MQSEPYSVFYTGATPFFANILWTNFGIKRLELFQNWIFREKISENILTISPFSTIRRQMAKSLCLYTTLLPKTFAGHKKLPPNKKVLAKAFRKMIILVVISFHSTHHSRLSGGTKFLLLALWKRVSYQIAMIRYPQIDLNCQSTGAGNNIWFWIIWNSRSQRENMRVFVRQSEEKKMSSDIIEIKGLSMTAHSGIFQE